MTNTNQSGRAEKIGTGVYRLLLLAVLAYIAVSVGSISRGIDVSVSGEVDVKNPTYDHARFRIDLNQPLRIDGP